MSLLKRLLSQVLNPRARLDQVPGLAHPSGPGSELMAPEMGDAPAGSRSYIRWRDVLLNFPFMLGAILVLALFAIVLFGPVWAPQNPYIAGQHIVPHFDAELGEFIRPPLDPSPEFPLGTDQWGTDILSLLMHGARNTLVASAFITMLRVILGVFLGGMAGWNENRWPDRLIMGVTGTINALPLLITAMILILALDIRRGLLVFIFALSVTGWSEIAQYIRSEFLVLRQQPFIEGARASGLNSLEIAVRHVLPNVLPQVLVITFLEMGAVLMLLGELGFVGIYIGGGSRISTGELFNNEVFTIAEVPEWGAMIADGFRWLRSKPHIVFPPALAFFTAVVGFTSLGEGLRRLIEKRRLNTSFLLSRKMILVVAGVTLATFFILNNTGAAPWFARVAQAFNGGQVYEHVELLVAMDGRGVGQPGGAEAAAYIADRFAEYGLEPGWRGGSYVYPLPARVVRPVTQPALALLDSAGNEIAGFQHQIDFGFLIQGHGGSGSVTAPVVFLGFDPNRGDFGWDAYRGLDLRGKIVLAAASNAPAGLATEVLIRGAAGILWISEDGADDVRSQIQFGADESEYMRAPNIPIFRIRPAVAQTLLDEADVTLAALFAPEAEHSQRGSGWFAQDLALQVHMDLQLGTPVDLDVPNVIGYLPGSDLDLADEMVVMFVSYDGLGVDPDGTVFPAANQNAAGVGVLLEMVRLINEQGLDARRTTLFVAWGGSSLDEDGARAFFNDNLNFRHLRTQSINPSVVPTYFFQLDQIGAGGDVLWLHPDGNTQLEALLSETGDEFSLDIAPAPDAALFNSADAGRRIPFWTALQWAGDPVAPTQDTLDRIDRAKLQTIGEMLTLALTRIIRETNF